VNRLASLVAACGALLLGACASFDRDWQAAAARPVRAADRVATAWDGKWTSEKHRLPNGTAAGGRLRCIFTRQDATHYRARFHANWLCFATGYEATFTTRPRSGGIDFRGEQDLGAIFGGVYRYEGRVTRDRFLARFASRYDHGTFAMSRPAEGPTPGRLTP